jgi:hypothetical protein
MPDGMAAVWGASAENFAALAQSSPLGSWIALDIFKPLDSLFNLWTNVFPGFEIGGRGWTDLNNTDRFYNATSNIRGRIVARLRYGPTLHGGGDPTIVSLRARCFQGTSNLLATFNSPSFAVTGDDQFHSVDLDFTFDPPANNWTLLEFNTVRASGDLGYSLQGVSGEIYMIVEPDS